ncbi:hypothetical protein F9L16_04565 [Agarivorans sp. B2Z047]|uniref:hypothetical protein n=1 Tax=Agarivorans sp. B2Z047 TaxID=2652721 RepID=UPI00128D7B32|nr:hypothetical protein [Agarivorans sp. B2Z047]MPW28272.1 hypothetical protein [Agarivorans sp. B2Z047]UQN43900.1 hypothetical protein LQZ07_05375 [Agarivorans sp. B2Z047]
MDLYEQADIQLLMDSGSLKSCEMASYPMRNGSWLLMFTRNDKATCALCAKRGKEPRQFKTADAALRLAKEIGFEKVRVNLK